MITIMGASGNTGRAVAEHLLEAGEKVRVLGRSAEKLAGFKAKGAEVMTGDATDAGYLTRSFKGADAVYTLLPPNFGASDFRAYQDQLGEAIVQAIRDSGVKHVVFLSSLGADLLSGTGPIAGLHAQEERLKKLSGVHVLSLRAGYFMENHFMSLGMIKHQGMNGSAVAGDVPIAMVAARDISEVAAKALRARGFKGFSFHEILGPREVMMAEATKIIGKRVGKPGVEYVQFPYEDSQKAMVGMGISESLASLYVEMGRAFNERKVHSLQGRNAQTTTRTRLEDFAEVLAKAYEGA
ncbi:MAG: NAD(P)H-binding protein [Candidatus Krumholzibacteria bacterium]|nr:NAD(P)H-binding protein [Candidatus Krumholzibacteria bacterium]